MKIEVLSEVPDPKTGKSLKPGHVITVQPAYDRFWRRRIRDKTVKRVEEKVVVSAPLEKPLKKGSSK